MIVWVGAAWAGGFEVAQQSAVAGGTGHASTARAGDPAAAWFDPAALADGGGLQIAVGAAVASATIRATGDDWQSTSDNALGTPPHLYASYAGGPFLAGVAVNTAFAGGVRWPDDGPLRFESIESSPRFFRIAPFVGGSIGRVRIAGGIHVDAGSLLVRKATDHVTEEGSATISLRGAGIGADAALYVTLADPLALGISYKSRTSLALAGEADFDVPDPFASGLADQEVSAPWTLPDRLAVGLAWNEERFAVLADAVFTAWSVNDELPIDFVDPATDDVTQVNRWRNSLAVRGGAEVRAHPVTVRAGAYVDTAPSPTATLGASSPDGPRVAGTAGAGVAIGEHARLDLFGEVLRVLPRSTTSPDGPASIYQGRALVAGLTAGLAF